jgi:hypothetical protein
MSPSFVLITLNTKFDSTSGETFEYSFYSWQREDGNQKTFGIININFSSCFSSTTKFKFLPTRHSTSFLTWGYEIKLMQILFRERRDDG